MNLRLEPRIVKILMGAAAAVATFAAVGTPTALWRNPFFVRMTPAGDFEIAALLALSLLFGVYVAIRRPACSVKTAGAGGVLGFLGIACPVCNKLLVLLIGGDLLMAYFEPIRLYVALAGVVLAAVAVGREWHRIRASAHRPLSAPNSLTVDCAQPRQAP